MRTSSDNPGKHNQTLWQGLGSATLYGHADILENSVLATLFASGPFLFQSDITPVHKVGS